MTEVEKKIFAQLMSEFVTVKLRRSVLVAILGRLNVDLNRLLNMARELRGIDQEISIQETRVLIKALETALTPNSHD